MYVELIDTIYYMFRLPNRIESDAQKLDPTKSVWLFLCKVILPAVPLNYSNVFQCVFFLNYTNHDTFVFSAFETIAFLIIWILIYVIVDIVLGSRSYASFHTRFHSFEAKKNVIFHITSSNAHCFFFILMQRLTNFCRNVWRKNRQTHSKNMNRQWVLQTPDKHSTFGSFQMNRMLIKTIIDICSRNN